MKPLHAFVFAALAGSLHAATEGVRWLVEYDGKAMPAASVWQSRGKPEASVADGALKLAESSREGVGSFRAAWKVEPDADIFVEATVRVSGTTGAISKPGSKSFWPWSDGAPHRPTNIHVSAVCSRLAAQLWHFAFLPEKE